MTNNNVFMVNLPVASVLLRPLAALKKGAVLSGAFDKLSAREKYDLLEAHKVRAMPANRFRES